MTGGTLIRSSIMYCHRSDSKHIAAGFYWKDFCHHPRVCALYDHKAEVYEVTVEEGPDEPDSYWGWWSNGESPRGAPPRLNHVYYHRDLVEMCFPYGTAAEERRGRGVLVPVRLIRPKAGAPAGDGAG